MTKQLEQLLGIKHMVYKKWKKLISGIDFFYYILIKIVSSINKKTPKPHENAIWILSLFDAWLIGAFIFPIWSRVVFKKAFSVSRLELDIYYYKNLGLVFIIIFLIQYFVYYRRYAKILEHFDKWTSEKKWNMALTYFSIFLLFFIVSTALLIKKIS